MNLEEMVQEWGNEEWAAPLPFLQYVADHVQDTEGSIVELGSGLSTVVIDMCIDAGRSCWSIEEDAGWVEYVRPRVDRVELIHAPIVDGWYDTAGLGCIQDIGLVVCDGPRGRRTGVTHLVPRMRSGCPVLFEDANRDEVLIRKWTVAVGASLDWLDREGRGVARATMP